MSENYDDIIDLPHPTSLRHKRMPLLDRAAQFAPFAALSGYDEAIKEAGRLTEEEITLSEEEREAIDEEIQELARRAEVATITYFKPDEKKSGGSYLSVEGVIKKADGIERTITLGDGTKIAFSSIISIAPACLSASASVPFKV